MIFRGSTVEFSTTFEDAAGEPISPDVAELTINFPALTSGRDSTTMFLDPSGSDWVANWDSSEAKPGMVRWSIKAVAGDVLIADDGEFCLSANIANTPDSPTPTSTILTDESGNSITTEDGDTIVTA